MSATAKKKAKTKRGKAGSPAVPGSQFWVLDTGTEGSSASTLQAHGPFHTQDRAEQWIKDTSADFWMESCGCLRTGDPEKWGDEHIIVQVVRKVKPVPPSSVVMTLVDTENVEVSDRAGDGARS